MNLYLNKRHFRVVFALIITLLGTLPALAQVQNARQAFIDAPAEILPSLGDVERANILATYDAILKGQTPPEPSKNLLGGEVNVLQLNNSYIQMRLDESTELQIKLLPNKKGRSIVAMVVTSLLSPKQSVIAFYDEDWVRLDTNKYIQFPKAREYFAMTASNAERSVNQALVERGRISYEIIINADEPELTFRMTTFDNKFARELHPNVVPLIKNDGVRYIWLNKDGFIKE